MKTTIEIPDALFRKAKVKAAERGIPLRALMVSALTRELEPERDADKPWMKTFGGLKHLHKETLRINQIIDEEFGQIEPEDWK